MFRTIAADAARRTSSSVTDAAWGLYMAGERGDAARVLEQALQLDGGYGPAYHLRAWLRLTAGEFDGAASDFREAYERTVEPTATSRNSALPGGDIVALYYEGVAHQKAGAAAEASAAWRAVVSDSRQVAASTTNPGGRWQAGVLAALAAVRMGTVGVPPRASRAMTRRGRSWPRRACTRCWGSARMPSRTCATRLAGPRRPAACARRPGLRRVARDARVRAVGSRRRAAAD